MEIIRIFPLGDLETNCYILKNEKKECIVVDPAEEEPVTNFLNQNNLILKYIILTHGHYDHIGGVNLLKEKTNCKVLAGKNEKKILETPEFNYSYMTGTPLKIIPDMLLENNQVIENLKILETPGHTKGGISIIGKDFIISGDTLFFESIGRTDLYGGSYEHIINSIKEKLFVYPDNFKVYPGHGPSTTIGHEKKHNMFLK